MLEKRLNSNKLWEIAHKRFTKPSNPKLLETWNQSGNHKREMWSDKQPLNMSLVLVDLMVPILPLTRREFPIRTKLWWIKSPISTLVMSLKKWARSNYRTKFLIAYAKQELLSLQLCKLLRKEELEKRDNHLKSYNRNLLHLQVIEPNRCKPHLMLNSCKKREKKKPKALPLKLFQTRVHQFKFLIHYIDKKVPWDCPKIKWKMIM